MIQRRLAWPLHKDDTKLLRWNALRCDFFFSLVDETFCIVFFSACTSFCFFLFYVFLFLVLAFLGLA
ncbi:hypothetical protein BC940DRAFT_308387 [Gongronella butleri]|nr:hypothetical protein BC940DRAFT_308387 [Gongronella butleri]